MAISNWLCSNSTKNMLVKIVHPGGHVELYDRPIAAADVMRRNPKCCVANPNVFKQPWSILAPDTLLMPGHKFYVVPVSTIRKLQLLSKRHPPALIQKIETIPSVKNDGDCYGKIASCGLIQKSCTKQFKSKGAESEELGRWCCTFLPTGMLNKASSADKSKQLTSSNSVGSSETNMLTKKWNKDSAASPKRLSSFDSWQPNLESIIEEFTV